MRAPVATLAAALLALCAAPAPARQAGADAQSITVTGQRDPSNWLRAESPHLVVYTDTSAADARRLLAQLERLDFLLRLYTAPYAKAEAGQKLTLYYLDSNREFARFATDVPQDAIGLVSSCAAGVLGVAVQVDPIDALSDDQLAHEPLDPGQSYLFEAYARHFLYRHTDVRTPAAFIEGMASYFSALRFSKTRMVVGRTPTGVGRYLGHLDEGNPYELDYADVFARSYADAPTATPTDMRTRAKALEFQARAWALVHYMLSTDARRQRLPGFLDAVHQGRPPAQAFEQSYGIALADLGTAMWRYRLQAMKVLQVALPAMPAPAIDVTQLSRAAGELVLPEAVRASCPGTAAGKALLHTALEQVAQKPAGDTAHAILARTQVEWGDAQDVKAALPWLEQAAAHTPGDFDAAYWLGRANLRLAAQDPARLPPARAQLVRASALRPGAPEAALARLQAALLAGEPPDRPSLDAVTAAWRQAHDSNPLARAAVLAYAWTGQPDAALHVLRVLANDSRDRESQAWAADWQARLAHGVAPAALFAEMRRTTTLDGAVREWTIDQDGVAAEVEREAGIEAARQMIDRESASSGSLVVPQAGDAKR